MEKNFINLNLNSNYIYDQNPFSQFSNIKASLNNNCNTETHVCGRIRDNIKVGKVI